MKFIHALLVLFFLLVHPVDATELTQRALIKTPVEIKGFFVRDNTAEVQATVQGATTSSQVVVLVRYSSKPGLSVAANESGEPMLPKTIEKLPPSVQGDLPDRQSLSRWIVSFYSRPEFGKIVELYAVVCVVQERGEWSRSRDYRGFQYLPFGRSQSIDEALDLLRNFGWSPTGVTRFAP